MLFLSSQLFGQYFNGGLHLGHNFSQMVFSHRYYKKQYDDIKHGWEIGAFTNFKINKKTIGQVEINLIPKGLNNNYQNYDGSISYNANYIEPAFLLKYQLGKKLYIGGGFSMGYLMNNRVVPHLEKNYLNVDSLTFTKFDKSLVAQLSWRVTNKIELNVRLTHSIISISSFDEKAYWFIFIYGNDKGIFNQVLSANFYYTINSKKN